MRAKFTDRFIGINGGIVSLDDAVSLRANVDGVMLGRAAYQNPALLTEVDHRFYGEDFSAPSMDDIRDGMMEYIARHLSKGGRVNHVTRHMIGLFQGQPGARRFRQILSVEACKDGATEDVVARAFEVMDGHSVAA